MDSRTDDFITKCIKKHGEIYDYSETKYIDTKTKVNILCLKHGIFSQVPYSHLNGTGCPVCGKEKSAISKNKGPKFIDRSNRIHGFKYDYSKTNYISCKEKITIICPKHGEFFQTPDNHIQGRGCWECRNEDISNREKIPKVGKSFKDLYPELLKEWSNKNESSPDTYGPKSKRKVIWNCLSCLYEWEAALSTKVFSFKNNKNGCPACANKVVTDKNRLSIIRPDLVNEWDYGKNYPLTPNDVTYASNKKIYWVGPCGHKWKTQVCHRTIQMGNCPRCKKSKGEKVISLYLEQNDIKFKPQYRIKECKNKRALPFDFAIWINEELRLIEYNGEQHYGTRTSSYLMSRDNIELIKQRDKIKETYCKNNNIPLLIIPYWEKDNMNVILENFIRN